MATYYIYCLIDPRDEKRRYIGRTKNPEGRLRSHKVPNTRCSPALWHWLLRLKIAKLEPRMEMLATTDSLKDAHGIEREWIERGLVENWGILNVKVKGRCRLVDPFTLEEVK